jgi:hypothetical protein
MKYPKAKLAFITQPAPGMYVLNADDGSILVRLEISKEQLSNIVADGAVMVLRSRSGELSTPPETRR